MEEELREQCVYQEKLGMVICEAREQMMRD